MSDREQVTCSEMMMMSALY